MSQTETTVIEFDSAETVTPWSAIDDRIMGGASQSDPQYIDGVGLRFCGVVSLENDGGFASIRSEGMGCDLSKATGLRLKVRGDGRRYKFSLRTDSYFDGISYQAEFDTDADSWQEINLPFDAFIPTHHGLKLTTVAPMDCSHIESFGFFIANKTAESFQLDIAWIRPLA
ncbi:MAG: CIA30 family protein [Desulfuromonadales bacterium]|nr:CIA30 family protein [Desulfuromonadales bacterium]